MCRYVANGQPDELAIADGTSYESYKGNVASKYHDEQHHLQMLPFCKEPSIPPIVEW